MVLGGFRSFHVLVLIGSKRFCSLNGKALVSVSYGRSHLSWKKEDRNKSSLKHHFDQI